MFQSIKRLFIVKMNRRFYVSVALEGFEPSQAEPESDVLPLHHKALSVFAAAKLPLFFFLCNFFGQKISKNLHRLQYPAILCAEIFFVPDFFVPLHIFIII